MQDRIESHHLIFVLYILTNQKVSRSEHTGRHVACNKSRGKTTPPAQVKRQVAATGRGPGDTSHQQIASRVELCRTKSNQFEFVRLVVTTN